MNEERVRKAEMTTRLSGILFWKANTTGQFEEIYSRVIEWLWEIPEEEFDVSGALEVLGDVGG